MRKDKTQKDLRALGQLVEGTGAEVVLFLTPLISGKSARRVHLVNMCPKDQYSSADF